MGTIRVEFVPIQSFGLGLFGLDHIQLVYEDETDFLNTQDYWFVLEGIRDGGLFNATLGALGEDGTTSLAVANGASGDDLIAKIGTPEDRGSRIINTGSDALTLWNRMAAYAADIQSMSMPYIGASLPFSPTPTINSTTLISSVLWSIGVDLNNLMPFGIRNSPGAGTLIGTPDADTMSAQGNYTQIATGAGDDILGGSTNLVSVEKLYGGSGNDTFNWSFGQNVIHGGQPRMAYAEDGVDTVDYSGVGAVHIVSLKHAVAHKVADYVSTFAGGSDQLFSIEQVSWEIDNDIVTTGEGVELLEKPLLLDLKGQSGGRGDELGLSDGNAPVIINAIGNNIVSIQALVNAGEDAGYWAQSVEWLAGSNADDLIYTGPSILGAEGGKGDDLLDGRLANPFSGQSPDGYDVELDGGEGDDTIVSGEGRTLARGGDGQDIFVLSAMTSGNGKVEFIIDDADSGDMLYVPYDFFKVQRGDFDGSQLFQLSGAPFKLDSGLVTSYFAWSLDATDEVHGNIEFVGLVYYELQGSDLVITLLQGHPEVSTIDYGPDEPPGPTITQSVGETATETTIRVHNWSEGILGITFPLVWDVAVLDQVAEFNDYPGYRAAVNDATSGSRFKAALDDRPDAHIPKELTQGQATARAFAPAGQTEGTADDDVLTATVGGPFHLNGYAGNDDITGSDGGDVIDGGTGGDIMRGGRGNDTYYVDNAGDVIIEDIKSGFDRVISSIDYVLGEMVEHLALTGNAISGTGNARRNTLEGNDHNNTLTGGEGDDTFAGNGGDDVLIGGSGGDGYVYENGDGRDTIIETGNEPGADDVLILAGQLKPEDLTFIRDPNSANDLILSFVDGGRITIKDYFNQTGGSIESLQFTSGPTWSATEIATRAATAIVTSNEAPIARADDLYFRGQGPVTITAAALLSNDTDADGGSLAIAAIANASGGTVTLNPDGSVQVLPSVPGQSYITFDYWASDGQGGSSKGQAQLTVFANAAPVIASGALAAVSEDQSAAGRVVATDADNDTLIYSIKAGAGPLKGSVVLQSDGTFVYTPTANANGADSFTIALSDGVNAAVEQTFSFNIAPINDGPVAAADGGYTVTAGQRITILAADLLRNDSDIDGDTLSLTGVSAATGGTVQRDASGNIVFTATAGSAHAGSFDYSISDGQGGSSTARVSLALTASVDARLFIGTARADVLTGTRGDDTFIGKAGNDTLNGLTGNDVFKVDGDEGLDQINGGLGTDIVRGGGGNDVIRVKSALANLTSIEEIDGGRGFDRIEASAGNDVLDFSNRKLTSIELISLGAGHDTVRGSAGNDVFLGGAGHDTFVFRPGGGHDTVRDFEIGSYIGGVTDVVDLRGSGITDYLALWSHMHQAGADTIITLDAANSLRLSGVNADLLQLDNFRIL